MGRKFPGRDVLAAAARAAFGPGHGLVRVERLSGGSKKGVYRLVFDDGASAVGYVWDEAENYWPAPQHVPGESGGDLFSDASGAGQFEAGHALLHALGVRTPRVYLLDRSRARYPADIAVVEDVRGGTLQTQLEHGLPGARGALARLSASLEARTSGLDDQRLRFYRLALHLSLIAGPLRLLDGDFPDREPMMKIAAFNTGEVLAYLHQA